MKLVYIVGKIGFWEERMMFERLTQESMYEYIWIGDRKRWVAFDAICHDDGIVGKAINRLAAYEDTELTPEQVATLKAENEMLKSLTSDIPLDRLEEICKAYKEDRILILPKCQKCGLVNAWSIGKKHCDRCGASLSGGDV